MAEDLKQSEDKAPDKREEAGTPFDMLRREIDRVFDDVRSGAFRWPFRRAGMDLEVTWPRPEGWQMAPAMDLVEKDGAFEITAELPGLEERNVEVKVANNMLTIRGEKREEKEEKDKQYYLSERRYGAFQRSFRIPVGVDVDRIAASFAKSRAIPAGVGSRGRIELDEAEMAAMLAGGAAWAVAEGYGSEADLERIEERGTMAGARPDLVSERALLRQRREMGTLGSGNHYLEVQHVAEIFDADAARAFGLTDGQAVVMIHCGSRGLGHQIGTEYLREMALAAPAHGIVLPDRELACAPIASELGQRYLGVMRAGINCALANRQILTHLAAACSSASSPASERSCSMTSPTIPARRRPTRSTAAPAGSSCTARARPAPSDPVRPTCPRRLPPPASRC
jgi:HSP20 family molecular chaperone IbpA